MAVYSKAVSANQIIEGGITVCNGNTITNNNTKAKTYANIDSLGDIVALDSRFKEGPSGTWENWGG